MMDKFKQKLINKMMNVAYLQNNDISELENLLIKDGLLIPVNYHNLKEFSQNDISHFCVKHGIYQIPTIELLDFLRAEIKGLKTIEIGSGNGSIGRALDIPITDNRLQERPDVKLFYQATGQTPIKYPPDVEKIGGNEAVNKYKPECVIACWLTDVENGNYYGIREHVIVNQVSKYIHVGNEKTHGLKKVLKMFNFREFKAPWLVSRSMSKDENIIYIFGV